MTRAGGVPVLGAFGVQAGEEVDAGVIVEGAGPSHSRSPFCIRCWIATLAFVGPRRDAIRR